MSLYPPSSFSGRFRKGNALEFSARSKKARITRVLGAKPAAASRTKIETSREHTMLEVKDRLASELVQLYWPGVDVLVDVQDRAPTGQV